MIRRILYELLRYNLLLVGIAVGFTIVSFLPGCSNLVDVRPQPAATEAVGTYAPIDKEKAVIDPQTAQSIKAGASGLAKGASAVIWAMDGRELLLAQETGLMRYSPGNKELAPQAVLDERQQIQSTSPGLLAVAAQSLRLAWVSAERQVYTWTLSSQAAEQAIAESNYPITGLAISPGGQRIAYINVRGELIQMDISDSSAQTVSGTDSPNPSAPLDPAPGPFQAPAWLTQLSYSPDGKLIGGTDPGSFTVYIMDAQTGKIQRTLDWVDSPVASLYGAFFSPDWKQIAWVAQGQVQLMGTETAQPGPKLSHADTISALAWSPDGRLVATASAAIQGDALVPAVYLWEALNGYLVAQLNQPGAVVSLSFSPDGTQLAMLDGSGNVSIWSANQ